MVSGTGGVSVDTACGRTARVDDIITSELRNYCSLQLAAPGDACLFLSSLCVETTVILDTGFISSLGSDQVRYTHHVHQAHQAPAISPAGWLASLLLFGIPALTFALLFHCAGPNLLQRTTSWWRIFHLLLILPLALMLLAAFVGAAIDVRSTSRNALTQRLRLSFPSATAWIWAVALSGFMYGGNWLDV